MKLLFSHLLRAPLPVPEEHRRNFFHLYMDIFWFGVLNGSTLIFLAVFATRLGASPQQMGLLTAAPALVNLLFTLPAGVWVKRFNPHRATCWAWVATRVFYLLLAPLPLLLSPAGQVWAIILITLVMNVPGTVAAIIGNVFFAETVPEEWRSHVVGTRNALLALATTLTSLLSGQILAHLPFPTGYQIVFLIGFLGSALSCLHLFLIRPLPPQEPAGPPPAAAPPSTAGLKNLLRMEILGGPFRLTLILLIGYNLSVFIGQPIFPLYQVRVLHFTDATISLGTSVFWVVYFLGSTQAGALARRLGNQKLTALGAMLTSVSVLLFMVSYHPLIYAANNLIGGIGWSMLGSSVINYLLERVPATDRTPYLAWYNLAINAASLAGSLAGSWLASTIGLVAAMVIVMAARALTGFAILQWGGSPQTTPQSFDNPARQRYH